MALLARSFAARGYDVHMVTLDHGQPDGEVIDNVRVWHAYAPNSGIPVIRFVHPRATGLLQALSRADAEVYIQSCAGVATGLSAWYCRRRGAAFVYRAAVDEDFIRGRQFIQYARDRKIYEYGLRRADTIIAQTRSQQKLLARNYGLSAHLVGSLVESSVSSLDSTERSVDVLWVASMRPAKRPELALALGERLPARRFDVVGGPSPKGEQFYHELKQRALTLENVRWMGFQPYHETRAMFSDARVLLSTSESEGFPNVFLQAWITGTPVVAFFDPDGVISRERLGIVVHNLEEAAQAIERLLDDRQWWTECSERARAYVVKNHGAGIVDRYETVIAPLFGQRMTGYA